MVRTILCYDQLSTLIERNLFLLTVCREKSIASPGELGLETVGRVIESRVQNSAIAAARMEPAILFLLEEMNRRSGEGASQPARDVEADYTAADDEEVRDHYILPYLPWSLAGLPQILQICFLFDRIHTGPEMVMPVSY